jgi:hypothetical protein
MKSALDRVSEEYETAKRDRARYRFEHHKDDPVLNERCYCWSEALAILQARVGEVIR